MLSDDQYDRIAPCCKASPPTLVEPQETIDCLSRLCYGSRVLAAHGAIYRPILERGIACTNAFPGGLERKYGMRVLAKLAGDADLEEVFVDSTIVCAHQHAAGAAKKKANRRSGARVAD